MHVRSVTIKFQWYSHSTSSKNIAEIYHRTVFHLKLRCCLWLWLNQVISRFRVDLFSPSTPLCTQCTLQLLHPHWQTTRQYSHSAAICMVTGTKCTITYRTGPNLRGANFSRVRWEWSWPTIHPCTVQQDELFCEHNFRDWSQIREKHKNFALRKFGAVQYVLSGELMVVY